MKKTVAYEPMLVSYVDILGFADLIRTRSAGEISRILRVFNEATAPPKFRHDIPEMPREEHVSFSDLNMTVTPLRRRGNQGIVFFQFLRLVHAQILLLIEEGVLIRGGIAVGPATRSYRKYFGPAVLQSYALEQKKPGHPRILVGAGVLDEVARNPLLWMHDRDDELNAVRGFLAQDESGDTFIDYLRVAIGEVENGNFVLEQHDKLIRTRLAEFAGNDRIRAKYEWLRHYHDRTIKQMKTVAGRKER